MAEKCHKGEPLVAFDPHCGCDGLHGVVGRVPERGDGSGVSGVVVRGWDVLEVLEGED